MQCYGGKAFGPDPAGTRSYRYGAVVGIAVGILIYFCLCYAVADFGKGHNPSWQWILCYALFWPIFVGQILHLPNVITFVLFLILGPLAFIAISGMLGWRLASRRTPNGKPDQ